MGGVSFGVVDGDGDAPFVVVVAVVGAAVVVVGAVVVVVVVVVVGEGGGEGPQTSALFTSSMQPQLLVLRQ